MRTTGSSAARLERRRQRLRWLCAVTFVPFGVVHIAVPEKLMPIMPPPIPRPRAVIVATGVAEILGGVGLLLPGTRKAAAVGLALYVVGVYPANVYHALARVRVPPIPDSPWYHVPRLLFQPVFVWWALFAGGLVHRTPAAGRAPRRRGTG